MSVEFVLWQHKFPLHRKAWDYLEEACKRTFIDIFTVDELVEEAKAGRTSIYVVTDLENIIGCFNLCIRSNHGRLYLELQLLGGKNLKLWRDELVQFLFLMAKQHGCSRFTVIGRKGFEKVFPELKLFCCVYGHNLTEGSENIQ